MSIFGFIENFFFISLGIVFGLVLLLVYHFKNRMAVAEKKSESMYGLLSAIVKEIKSMRGMFGLGQTEVAPALNDKHESPTTCKNGEVFNIISKTIPEQVSTSSVTELLSDNIVLDLTAIEYSASQKIVVSDDDVSDDLEESESDSESESGSESERDSDEEIDETITEEEEELGEHLNPEFETVHVEKMESANLEEPVITEEAVLMNLEDDLQNADASNSLVDTSIAAHTSDDSEHSHAYTIDQLRKMNVNQLKTIAIQSGIITDTSKLKKPEIISLIQK